MSYRLQRISAFMEKGSGFPKLDELQQAVNRGDRIIALDGLTSTAAKAYVLSQIDAAGKTVVIVTDNNASHEQWQADLGFWTGSTGRSLLSLPSFETDVYSGSSPHAETMERRALSLWQMGQTFPHYLLLSARSLITRTVGPKEVAALGAKIKIDEDHSPDDLVERLAAS